jgi:hypothetical protein
MERSISEGIGRIIEEFRAVVFCKHFVEKVGVVAACGFQKEFFWGGTLNSVY